MDRLPVRVLVLVDRLPVLVDRLAVRVLVLVDRLPVRVLCISGTVRH